MNVVDTTLAVQSEYNDLEEEYAFTDSKPERVYLAQRMQECINRLAALHRRSTPGT